MVSCIFYEHFRDRAKSEATCQKLNVALTIVRTDECRIPKQSRGCSVLARWGLPLFHPKYRQKTLEPLNAVADD